MTTSTINNVNSFITENLSSSVIECFCETGSTYTALIVAPQTTTQTLPQRACAAVKNSAAAAATQVRKTVSKVRSFFGSLWNQAKSILQRISARVNSAAVGVKRFFVTRTAKTVTLCRKTIASSKAKAVAVSGKVRRHLRAAKTICVCQYLIVRAWLKVQCHRFAAWSLKTWLQVKPALRQVLRIGIFAMILYIFANAAVLASCVLVATLGVAAYDRAHASLLSQSSQSKKNPKKLPQQPLFGFLGI